MNQARSFSWECNVAFFSRPDAVKTPNPSMVLGPEDSAQTLPHLCVESLKQLQPQRILSRRHRAPSPRAGPAPPHASGIPPGAGHPAPLPPPADRCRNRAVHPAALRSRTPPHALAWVEPLPGQPSTPQGRHRSCGLGSPCPQGRAIVGVRAHRDSSELPRSQRNRLCFVSRR